jgi:hypothetical protein
VTRPRIPDAGVGTAVGVQVGVAVGTGAFRTSGRNSGPNGPVAVAVAGTVYACEHGLRPWQPDTLDLLAGALGVKPEEMLEETARR